jgi:integrase
MIYGFMIFCAHLVYREPMPKLTKTAVEALTKGFLWDNELPSFGVRCTDSGRKTYLIRYRNRYGQSKMYTFARTCDMPPDKARNLARELFSKIAQGVDISADKKACKTAPTVSEFLEQYLEYITPKMKPSTMVGYQIVVKKHITPKIGSLKLAAVTGDHLQRLFSQCSGMAGVRYRIYNFLKAVFVHSEKLGLREKHSNPIDTIERPTMPERHYILSDAEIANMFHVLDCGRYDVDFARMIKLLLLTGCRKGEIANAQTEWVDIQHGLLRLPDTKTGPRVVTLSDAAVELIRPAMNQRYICQHRSGKPYYTYYDVWIRLRKECGLPKHVRIHDLRHTVGSTAHFAGMSQREVADLLGHKQLRTTERYLHGTGRSKQNAERVASIMKIGA